MILISKAIAHLDDRIDALGEAHDAEPTNVLLARQMVDALNRRALLGRLSLSGIRMVAPIEAACRSIVDRVTPQLSFAF